MIPRLLCKVSICVTKDNFVMNAIEVKLLLVTTNICPAALGHKEDEQNYRFSYDSELDKIITEEQSPTLLIVLAFLSIDYDLRRVSKTFIIQEKLFG